jgi:hypothetical protein
MGQVAFTVNGVCCPRVMSASPQFPFVQRIFELAGGPAAELPGVVQLPDIASVFKEAHRFLDDVEDQLAAQIAADTPPDVTGPARSGAFRPDA